MYPYGRVDVGYRLFQMVLVLLVTKQNTVTMSIRMIEISRGGEAHHETRINTNRQSATMKLNTAIWENPLHCSPD